MPRTKQKHKKKNFFSRNTPPGYVSIRGKTQSLLYASLARGVLGRPPPHLKQRAAHGRRGRSFRKERLLQKIFVQIDEEIIIKNFTKPLDKPLPLCYNTDTNKGKRYTTMHAYTALIIFGLVAPIVFIAIPLLVENIMLKKEG